MGAWSEFHIYSLASPVQWLLRERGVVSQAICLAIFLSWKVGGGQFLCCPTTLKNGGTRPPVPTDRHPCLKGLKGVSVVADDILMCGKDQAEHDDNLRTFLKRARECGLKLNKKKCRFHMTELPYIGHILTSEGAREHVFQLQKHESQCQQFETINPVRDCPVIGALYVMIQKETDRDKLLQQLSEVIKNGWPKDITEAPQSARPWWTFRDELAIIDGGVYKGPIVVIPTSMHRDMPKRLHVSHQGLEATLRRARQSMFWHGMAVDVKQQIANCKACRRDAPKQKKETLLSHAVPNKPWRKVGIDIFTHSSIIYLVIVDYFSYYFEFEKLMTSAASDRDLQEMLCETRNTRNRALRQRISVFPHLNLLSSAMSGTSSTQPARRITPSRMGKPSQAKRLLKRAADPLPDLHRSTRYTSWIDASWTVVEPMTNQTVLRKRGNSEGHSTTTTSMRETYLQSKKVLRYS